MSRDYHATEFIGRLAADPETKYAETNGTARTRFRVLVNEEWKDRNEQVQKHVESYAVVAFNGLAEVCGNFSAEGGGCSCAGGTGLAATRPKAVTEIGVKRRRRRWSREPRPHLPANPLGSL
jgi:hypothetical protein